MYVLLMLRYLESPNIARDQKPIPDLSPKKAQIFLRILLHPGLQSDINDQLQLTRSSLFVSRARVIFLPNLWMGDTEAREGKGFLVIPLASEM